MGNDLWRTLDGGHDVEVLVDRQRHHIPNILQDASEPMELADLARELARRETTIDEDDEWKRARQYQIELYHHHAPKLAEAGCVTFDLDRQTVALAADRALDELETLNQ